MIKFFRKIRRHLLSEGKTGTYLKYAVGEIVLVVIGIVIALQINNWNENNKQNNLEQEALYNLKVDFELNKAELQEIIENTGTKINQSVEVLQHTGSKNSGDFLLDSLLLATVSAPLFNAQNGFLDDLINSGNLGILKNTILRSKLSSWQPYLEKLKRKEMYMEQTEVAIIDYVTAHGSWLNVDNYNLPKSDSPVSIPQSGFEVSNNDLLSSLEFENMVENVVIYLNNTRKSQRDCLTLCNEILELIQLELDEQD